MDQERRDSTQSHDSNSIENIETLGFRDDRPPYHPSTWDEQKQPVLYTSRSALEFGIPYRLFKFESSRELKRLINQEADALLGRPRRLPFDPYRPLIHNADNNVRARWIEQGIWRSGWGREWPDMTNGGSNTDFLHPWMRWAHEIDSPYPDELVTDVEASRPYRQFEFQVTKERERLEAEYRWMQERPPMYLDTMALEMTKQAWQDDGIWAPTWGELPGEKWLHEEPDLERFLVPDCRTIFEPREEHPDSDTDPDAPPYSPKLRKPFLRHSNQLSSSESHSADREGQQANRSRRPRRQRSTVLSGPLFGWINSTNAGSISSPVHHHKISKHQTKRLRLPLQEIGEDDTENSRRNMNGRADRQRKRRSSRLAASTNLEYRM